MKNLENLIKEAVDDTLKENGLSKKEVLEEAYAVQTGKFNLQTELLSQKTKKSHSELLEGYAKKLNEISSALDGVDKSSANLNNSQLRSLKIDETYNHNATFLHGLYFENISDLNSSLSMDTLTYMRLSRDFGTFDAWQEDFVACCLSARNGWGVTVYNTHLQRYMNTVIDLHSQNVMCGIIPVIIMDCWEHSYYRDYLRDRKTYVFGMMKELNWNVIEERFVKADLIAKVLKGGLK